MSTNQENARSEGVNWVPSVDEVYTRIGSTLGDRRDGRVYVHDQRIRAAVLVAEATGRPLLIRGVPGSGKSSLAPFVARVFRRKFYTHTVTARTEAKDLMWQFDAVRRLADAQLRREGDKNHDRVERAEHYIEPGVLWWAFDPTSARKRGVLDDLEVTPAKDPGIGPDGAGAVVLIDEIDKADPDVPNNLLECLGSLQFTVDESRGRIVIRATTPPMVLITTNDERELPDAFLRRCTVLHLAAHKTVDLVEIAVSHFAAPDDQDEAKTIRTICDQVSKSFETLTDDANKAGLRPPSTAEYLDAVRAWRKLKDGAQVSWSDVERLTLSKQPPATQE